MFTRTRPGFPVRPVSGIETFCLLENVREGYSVDSDKVTELV